MDQRDTAQSLKASLPTRFALPAAVFCLTTAAFMPTLENGVVNWDDGMNLLENPNYRGLSWSHLRWMFTTFYAAAAAAVAAKESYAATLDWEIHGWLSRFNQGCYGLIFYLVKTMLPVGLSPLYELTPEFSRRVMSIFLYAIPVVGITIGLWLRRKKWPAGFAAWLSFVGLLAPVLGVVQSGPQLTADGYSYLACLPWAALGGAALVPFGRWNDTGLITFPRAALPMAGGEKFPSRPSLRTGGRSPS